MNWRFSIWRSGLRGAKGDTGSAGAAGSTGAAGATGAVGPQGPVGATGATGATGPAGPAGALVYNASGLVANAKIWSGTVTTNASGAWSVDYSAAGFSSAPVVQATVVGAGANAAQTRNASLSATPTTTGAAGIATTPATISLLGVLTVTLAPAGAVVHVTAVGA